MPLFIRKVEQTITRYEMVRTNSSSAAYVERDKSPHNVALLPVGKPEIVEMEPWREAKEFEVAAYERADGFDD